MNEKQMAAHPVVAAYIEEVCRHVKVKEVHKDIAHELLGHLLERTEELMELEQLNEEEAIAAAVKGMGDAREVGIGLDAAHKPKAEWSVIAVFAVMLLLAVVSLFAMPEELRFSVAYKLVIALVGVLLMVAAYFGNYQKLARWSWALYGITLACMIYALLFGTQINGARQWLSLGRYGFNISEVSPYLFIVAIAGILYRDQTRQHTSRLSSSMNICKELIAFILLPLFVYVLTPTLSSLVIYLLGLFVLLLVFGKWRIMLASVGTLIAGMALLLSYNDSKLMYIYLRLTSMFSKDPDVNYQAMRSVEAIRAGGMWGQGIGVANPNLPFAYGEMMYAYLIYSLGWIFGIVIVLVALTFVWRTIQMGLKTRDSYGRALIVGVCSIFGLRLLWNLLMCLGVVPIMGITPPFLHLSSSTLFEFCLLGFILGVYRRKDMISQSQSIHSALTK